MKAFLGYFLLVIGLTILIRATLKDASDWYFLLGILLFGGGLELVIEERVNRAKKELMDEIDEIKSVLPKEERHNPYEY